MIQITKLISTSISVVFCFVVDWEHTATAFKKMQQTTSWNLSEQDLTIPLSLNHSPIRWSSGFSLSSAHMQRPFSKVLDALCCNMPTCNKQPNKTQTVRCLPHFGTWKITGHSPRLELWRASERSHRGVNHGFIHRRRISAAFVNGCPQCPLTNRTAGYLLLAVRKGSTL